MDATEEALQPQSFKAARIRLIAGGILQLIVGIDCAYQFAYATYGLYYFTYFPATVEHSFLYSPFFKFCQFAFLTPWFLIMALGSLSMRRWARSLTLIAAGAMLILGISILISTGFVRPFFFRLLPHPERMRFDISYPFLRGTIIFVAQKYIAFPVILILLYSDKGLKQICEHFTPRSSWTDRRPLPVLAASFLLCFQLYPLSRIFSSQQELISVGWLERQAVPQATVLVIGLTYIIARGLYQLRTWAWWSAIITTPLFFISFTTLYIQGHYAEIIYHARYYENTPGKMEALNVISDVWLPALLVMLCLMAFLVYIKRYFKDNAASPIADHNPRTKEDTIPPAP